MLKILSISPSRECQHWLPFSIRPIHTTSSCHIKDYYQILGLSQNATIQQIKSAYYKKAKTHHPDSTKSNSSAKNFQQISEAYQVLSDENKRRAYDNTVRPYSSRSPSSSHFSQSQEKSSSASRTTVDTMSMNHIQHVYKTLNKEPMEEPKFRPFEDHNYPGTNFNRFVYSRYWDSTSKSWMYQKRKTANKYYESMKSKAKILNTCLTVFVLGSGLFVFNCNFTFSKLTNQSKGKLDENRAGMYMMVDGSPKLLDKSE